QWKRLNQFPFAAFGSGEAKNRAQSFAAGEQTVAHRFMERRRFHARLRQMSIQRPVDQFLPRSKIGFEIHRRVGRWMQESRSSTSNFAAIAFREHRLLTCAPRMRPRRWVLFYVRTSERCCAKR